MAYSGRKELKVLNQMMQPYNWTAVQKANAPPAELILSSVFDSTEVSPSLADAQS